jgi:cation-transporting ATPase 13A1
MCGDGTNDVGALKHAQVGVALLANAPLQPSELQKPRKTTNDLSHSPNNDVTNNLPRNRIGRRPHAERNSANSSQMTRSQQRVADTQQQLQKMLQEMEEQEKASVVKLGDASIAAPFTSKLSSIQCSQYLNRY